MSGPRIDIEDTGPALDAIAAQAFGEAWATMFPGKKALAKQELLDLLLPGLQVILNQANEQMAAVLGEQRDAVLALHPKVTLYAYCEGDWDFCDPSDSNHAESTHDGELMHLNDRIEDVCGSCFDADGEQSSYPCPTARALGVTE